MYLKDPRLMEAFGVIIGIDMNQAHQKQETQKQQQQQENKKRRRKTN